MWLLLRALLAAGAWRGVCLGSLGDQLVSGVNLETNWRAVGQLGGQPRLTWRVTERKFRPLLELAVGCSLETWPSALHQVDRVSSK